MTTTSPTIPRPPPHRSSRPNPQRRRREPFPPPCKSEWIKLATLRANKVILALHRR